MKKYLTTLALLCGMAAADSVVDYDELRISCNDTAAAIRFDEPVVPRSATGLEASKGVEEQLAPDLFEVTGDAAHMPQVVWMDQDYLTISFPDGTSCTTEYRLSFRPGCAKYLSGKPMPQTEFTFRCPKPLLQAYRVEGMRDGTFVVMHDDRGGFFTKEALEFGPDTPGVFFYRAEHGETVAAKVGPVRVKHLQSASVLELFARSHPDWAALTAEDVIPGAVLVEPVSPLPCGKDDPMLWKLCQSGVPMVEAGALDGCYAGDGISTDAVAGYDTKTGKLVVSVWFSSMLTEEEALRAVRGLRVYNGETAAVDSEDGMLKTVPVEGGECRVSFSRLLPFDDEAAEARRARRTGRSWYVNKPGMPVTYAPPGEVYGFQLEVEGPVPAVLDFEVPQGVVSALGGCKTTEPDRHRLSLNPAIPGLGHKTELLEGDYANDSLGFGSYRNGTTPMAVLPLKGEHKVRVQLVNEESVEVTAYRMPGDFATANLQHIEKAVLHGQETGDKLRRVAFSIANLVRLEKQGADMQEELETFNKLADKVRNTYAENLLKRLKPCGEHRFPLPPGAAPFRSMEAVLDLDALQDGALEPGIYMLRITPRANAAVRKALAGMDLKEDYLDVPRYAFVQVTDLHALSGSRVRGELLLTRLSDGSPVERAKLTLIHVERPLEHGDPVQLPCQEETAELTDGCIELARQFRRAYGELALLVESGADYTVLPFSHVYDSYHAPAFDSDACHHGRLQTDRRLYRPGETVHVRGFLRWVDGEGNASLPRAESVRFHVFRGDGRELVDRVVRLDASGGIDEQFTLPEGGEDVTGSVNIEMALPDGSCSVYAPVYCEVFRRDSFELTPRLEVEGIAPEGFTFTLGAEDFSGVPLAGGKLSATITSRVPIEGWKEEESKACRSIRGESYRTFEYRCERTLDAEGKVEITGRFAPLGPADEGLLEISGSVSNDRGETVLLDVPDVRLYPADFEPLLDYKGRIHACPNEEGQGRVLDRDQTIHVTMLADVHRTLLLPNGFVVKEEKKDVTLYEADVTVPAGEAAGVDWGGHDVWREVVRPDGMDNIRLVLSGTDAQGRKVERTERISRYDSRFIRGAGRRGPASQYTYTEDGCGLAADGSLHLRAEFRHTGTAVCRIHSRGGLHCLTLPVQAGQSGLDVPLPEGVEGDVEVIATVPFQEGGAFICFEHHAAKLRVPRTSCALQTQLAVPAKPVRPGESITVSGQVSKDGKGTPATVTLFAVDAGMLSLTDFRVVDLSGGFPAPYMSISWGVNPTVCLWPPTEADDDDEPRVMMLPGPYVSCYTAFYYDVYGVGDGSLYSPDCARRARMLADVDAAWYETGGEITGLGEGLGCSGHAYGAAGCPRPRLRTDFQPVALWQGALKTDAEGRFSVEVELPDTLTTYRVFALVLGDDGSTFGNAQAEFTVNQPLMLTPGTPLSMSVGDSLRLPLTVTNNSDADGTWTVSISSAAGPQKVTIPAHGTATLYFDVTATAEGECTLEWCAVAEDDGAGDAVRGSFPVRFPAPVLKEVHHLVLAPGQERKLAELITPELAESTRGEVEVYLSSSPLLHLTGCMDYLLTYPYGCTEQTSSGLLPWLFYKRLAPLSHALSKTSPAEVDRVIGQTLENLFTRQKEDGGLGYWSDSPASCAWASAHAALVFTIAIEQGYGDRIPAGRMEALRGYLRQHLAELRADAAKWREASPRTLFALGRVLGDDAAVEEALSRLDGDWTKDMWWHHDIGVDLAFIRALHQDPAGKHGAFLQWMRSRGHDPRHTSTMRSAWMLFALSEYLRLTPDSSVESTVALQDGTVLTLNGGTTVLKPKAVRLSTLPTVLKAVQGEVYASVWVKAVPECADYAGVSEKGLLVSRIYEKKGADGIWREATEFEVGDVVRVTLTCTASSPEMKYLVLEDYLPSCMEAINPAIHSQAAGLEPVPWSLWIDHKEYLADRVRGFCTRWGGREHLNMTYYARVMRAGTSTAPPAQAQLMYEPQTYGLSTNTKIQSK